MIHRRQILTGLIAAPAIVAATNIMKINPAFANAAFETSNAYLAAEQFAAKLLFDGLINTWSIVHMEKEDRDKIDIFTYKRLDGWIPAFEIRRHFRNYGYVSGEVYFRESDNSYVAPVIPLTDRMIFKEYNNHSIEDYIKHRIGVYPC